MGTPDPQTPNPEFFVKLINICIGENKCSMDLKEMPGVRARQIHMAKRMPQLKELLADGASGVAFEGRNDWLLSAVKAAGARWMLLLVGSYLHPASAPWLVGFPLLVRSYLADCSS